MRGNRHNRSVIAVVIRQYGTGLYRSYVSLSHESSICLGTHSDEESATDRLNHFWKAYDEGSIRTSEDLNCLIDPPSGNGSDTAATSQPEPAGANRSQPEIARDY